MTDIEHELKSVVAMLRTAIETLIDVQVKLAEIRVKQEQDKQAEHDVSRN